MCQSKRRVGTAVLDRHWVQSMESYETEKMQPRWRYYAAALMLHAWIEVINIPARFLRSNSEGSRSEQACPLGAKGNPCVTRLS